ncbi:MAG: hypothetical protein HY553_20515 [Elusimicrobia bacterium]|nr:hypothetical protein [Elusimicrobiota bacterium]
MARRVSAFAVFVLSALCPLGASAGPFEDARDVAVRVEDREKERKAVEQEARRIEGLLDWYGRLARMPAMGVDELSAKLVVRLRSGEANTLILGESHGNAAEFEAAERLVGSVLASGVPVGMFLQEPTEVRDHVTGRLLEPRGIFKRPDLLERNAVPIVLMKHHFTPDRDVRDALAAARPGVLITYTGSVHTAPRMRDFVIGKLEMRDMGWGRVAPTRPVVEGSVKAAGRRPLVVAMWHEERTFEVILNRRLVELTKGATAAEWPRRLRTLEQAWLSVMAPLPASPPVRFVKDPERSNFYVGIAAGNRGLRAVAAAAEVAADPKFAGWLGGSKIKVFAADRIEIAPFEDRRRAYHISVGKGGAERFERAVVEP